MTKADLIEQMAKEANITKTAAADALEAFLKGVTSGLAAADGKVTLVGFGTFQTVARKARKGRNPATGAEIDIPASKSVKFKPGKQLKDAVE